jgi:hypothetical protein
MSNIYKFRVLLDTEQEVFRDIEIRPESTFEHLHRAIQDAFGFSGKEMASFYLSNDEWERGREIPLMDMNYGEDDEALYAMSEIKIGELIRKSGQKLIYIYDFLRMWGFFVEMVEISPMDSAHTYPRVAMSLGDAPDEGSKDMDFNMETDSADGEDEDEDYYDDYEDDFDEGDLDQFNEH